MSSTKRRIDGFRGTDSQYVAFLESKVQQLTEVVLKGQGCFTQTPICSPPTSPRPRDNYDSGPNHKLRFIEYDPEALQPSVKKQKTKAPRWQSEMDDMLRGISSSPGWISKREEVGLSSPVELLAAYDIIIDGARPLAKPGTADVDRSLIRYEPSRALLQLVNTYAATTAALEVDKKFTVQVYRFRVLVLVSLCCVLLHNGVDKGLVDEAMHAGISQSEDRHLDLLRRGASWVNRVIYELGSNGLGHRASELFVLCGGSMSAYGRFADAGKVGFSYFVNRVSAFGIKAPKAEIQASLPFLVPFFIKKIVGGIYSLSNICGALCKGAELTFEDYSLYEENYHSRAILLTLAHQAHVDVIDDHVTGRRPEAEAPQHLDSIQALLIAADQMSSNNSSSTMDRIGLTQSQSLLTEVYEHPGAFSFQTSDFRAGCEDHHNISAGSQGEPRQSSAAFRHVDVIRGELQSTFDSAGAPQMHISQDGTRSDTADTLTTRFDHSQVNALQQFCATVDAPMTEGIALSAAALQLRESGIDLDALDYNFDLDPSYTFDLDNVPFTFDL